METETATVDRRTLMAYVNRERRVLAAMVSLQGKRELFPERTVQQHLREVAVLLELSDAESTSLRSRWQTLEGTPVLATGHAQPGDGPVQKLSVPP